ncbi:MAG: GH12 family glycosyl hydrolase domain-containing protein [Brevinematia bacterium]
MKSKIFIMLLCLVTSIQIYGMPKRPDRMIVLDKPSFTNFQVKNIPLSMELNFWNIESYEGTTYLRFNEKLDSVEFFANLSNIKQKNPSAWVSGYPEVFYGFKPWLSNGTSAKIWQLPEKIKDLEDIVFAFQYELWYEGNLPVNLAMETWVTKEKYPSSVKAGEVEVMVWLYYNLLNPAGFKVGEVEIPVILDGREKSFLWEVWYAAMTWDYVAFRPITPIEKGAIEISIKPFIFKAKEVLSNYSERIKIDDFENMYLEVWETGTEFGSPSSTNVKMGYKFSNFEIKKK